MAYHGGSLEEVTDVVATAAAEKAGASLYAVVQPPDFRWHIPSTEVRPEHSAALREFLDHVEVVVTVHGYGREGFWTTLLLGGQNRDARRPCRVAPAARAPRLHDRHRPRLDPVGAAGPASREPGEPAAWRRRAARAAATGARAQPDLEGLGRPGPRAAHRRADRGPGRRRVDLGRGRRGLGPEPFDRPAVGGTAEAEAVVQPVGSALPHLERLVREPIAAPVRGPRHRHVAIPLVDLRDRLVEERSLRRAPRSAATPTRRAGSHGAGSRSTRPTRCRRSGSRCRSRGPDGAAAATRRRGLHEGSRRALVPSGWCDS